MPSDAGLQIRVARVSKPIGRKIKVAGSSFIDVRKTNEPPINRPRRTSGHVTVRKIEKPLRPSVLAASSKVGDKAAKALRDEAAACGRKRMT